jgi:putative phosphoesterase
MKGQPVPAALIGDVHANLPALRAVLKHARQQGAETIWNVGDFVGYGPFPNQVVKRLRKLESISIIGNYDLKVLKIKRKKEKWLNKRDPLKILAFRWAYKNLSKKSKKYLRSLPKKRRFEWEGRRVLLTHASPASNEEALDATTPEQRLRELAQMAKVDLIVCGHSHRPFVRRVDDVWFINTGSVGRPDDGDPRATYAVLKNASEEIEVEHFRVAYNVEKSVAAIRKKGLPEEFAQMLLRGISLDDMMSFEE